MTKEGSNNRELEEDPDLLGELRIKFLHKILTPIVRFVLRGGHNYQSFTEVLKQVYVRESARLVAKTGKKVNVSRVALVSGLHFNLVNSLLQQQDDVVPETTSVVAQIITAWENNPEYLTKAKKPRSLTKSGPGSEFWELVKSVNKHLNPGAVLFELERVHAVKVTKQGVSLKKSYEPNVADPEKALSLMARGIGTLIETIESNVKIKSVSEIPDLHMHTEFDAIFVEDIPKVREWIAVEGKKFHRKLRNYLSEHDSDINFQPGRESGGKVSVMTCGISLEKDEK